MFITDYMKVYETAIPPDLCDEMIQRYEKSLSRSLEVEQPEGMPRSVRSWEQLVLSKDDDSWQDVMAAMMKLAELAVGKYQSEIPVRTFPKEIGIENFKIMKFRQGEDHSDYHVDVNSYASARRFTTLVWFLNDVQKGGEFFFPHPNIRVGGRKGRILMCPTTWIYPYAIDPPQSGDMYVATTYLHYI